MVNWMQLEAPESQIADCTFQFVNCPTVFPRIDRGETNELLRMRVYQLGNVIVRVRTVSGRGLGID